MWWNRKKEKSSSPSPSPIEITPLIGWRGWNLTEDGHLRSSTRIISWPFRKPMVVDDPNWHRDESPNGIHAFILRRQLLGTGYVGGIFGSVYLWGRVIEHEHGYRAEFAYPKELFVSPKTDPLKIMQIEHNYGVPVETDEEFFPDRPCAPFQHPFTPVNGMIATTSMSSITWSQQNNGPWSMMQSLLGSASERKL